MVECKGNGWWLTLMDMLMSEYGWSVEVAMGTRVNVALLLRYAVAARSGAELKPSLLEVELVRRLGNNFREKK